MIADLKAAVDQYKAEVDNLKKKINELYYDCKTLKAQLEMVQASVRTRKEMLDLHGLD